MGLLDWIFRKPNFHRVEDSYALTRDKLWGGLKKSLETQLQQGNSTWLVVHFLDTFTQIQEQLEQWGFEYEIVSSRLNANELERTGLLTNGSFPAPFKLILAELVPEPPQLSGLLPVDIQKQVAMIVLERHPQIKHDQRLLSFAKSVPLKTEFGYLLALDDPTVVLAIDDKVTQILKQLGWQSEMISSNMVTRRLETVLKRIANDFTGDTPCNSAQEWLQVNAR